MICPFSITDWEGGGDTDNPNMLISWGLKNNIVVHCDDALFGANFFLLVCGQVFGEIFLHPHSGEPWFT